MDKVQLLDTILRERRAIYPAMYADKEIPEAEIERILESANHAPTHRMTQPWRFRVFRGKALESLSDYLGNYYQAHTPEEKFSAMKLKKTIRKPLHSACVIAICMQRDPEERVPEWEEVAAVSMAVQNMWLSCSVRGIGCYWSSPRSILEAREFIGLEEGERCLGLFYMGYAARIPGAPKRDPIDEKVIWMD